MKVGQCTVSGVGTFGTIRTFGIFRYLRDLGHSWTILGYFGPFWTILDYLGPFWNISNHFWPFKKFRAILDHFGLLWTIWTTLDHFGPFGTFWKILDHFGPLWNPLDILIHLRYLGKNTYVWFWQITSKSLYWLEKKTDMVSHVIRW